MGLSVRIDKETDLVLDDLAIQMNQPKKDVVARAIMELKRQLLLESTNRGYAELRSDPNAWREQCAERALWEGAASDGLGGG